MVWVLVGVRCCVLRQMGHSSVTLFSLSMSVKDRTLHWTLGKSQTYYPEHILGYGHMILIAYHLLESSTGAYIEWLVNVLMLTANKIEYKDERLVILPADAINPQVK